ncbi:MAG: hypothetical protein U0230_18295 [Polyangiales bacterium]
MRPSLPLALLLASLLPNVASAQTDAGVGTGVGNIVATITAIDTPDPANSRDATEDIAHGFNVFDCADQDTVQVTVRVAAQSGMALQGQQFDVWRGSTTGQCQKQANRLMNTGSCTYLGHFSAAGSNGAVVVMPLSTLMVDRTCDPNAAPSTTGRGSDGIFLLQTATTQDRSSEITNYGMFTFRLDTGRPMAVEPSNTAPTGEDSIPITWTTPNGDGESPLLFDVYAVKGGCSASTSDGGSSDAGVDASMDAAVDDAGTGDGGTGDGGTGLATLTPGGYLPTTYEAIPEGWTRIAHEISTSSHSLAPASFGLAIGESATVYIVPVDQALNTGAVSATVCATRIETLGLCDLLKANGQTCPDSGCTIAPIGDDRRPFVALLVPLALVALALRRSRRNK